VVGIKGRLDGMDISLASLKMAKQRIQNSDLEIELTQGDASYLPYKDEMFDAVLHIGGFNQFADRKRAISEMHRVAKSGAKIVFMDEGLAPGREKTLIGKYIIKCSKLFLNKPPVELLPKDIENLRVYWIYQGTFWVVDYRKKT
jgi:ubiquinone/menaquinone biosynthesis C-methylase UbiE